MDILKCGSCELSRNPDAAQQADRMCTTVASRVLSGLGSLGIDTTSDPADRKTLLAKSLLNPNVVELAEDACTDRLNEHENTSRGFPKVVY